MSSHIQAKMARARERLNDAWRTFLRRLRDYADRLNDRVEAERLRWLHRRHCRR